MLDRRAVMMYRKFVYGDGDSMLPLPDGLLALHQRMWDMLKQCGRAELNTEAIATVVMLWEASKKAESETRLAEMRPPKTLAAESIDDQPPFEVGNWDHVSRGEPVLLQHKNGKEGCGKFVRVNTSDGSLCIERDGVYSNWEPHRVTLAEDPVPA